MGIITANIKTFYDHRLRESNRNGTKRKKESHFPPIQRQSIIFYFSWLSLTRSHILLPIASFTRYCPFIITVEIIIERVLTWAKSEYFKIQNAGNVKRRNLSAIKGLTFSREGFVSLRAKYGGQAALFHQNIFYFPLFSNFPRLRVHQYL